MEVAGHQRLEKYLYTFTYDTFEQALSKLESITLFGKTDDSKLLWSNRRIAPSHSAFIKQRLEVMVQGEDYLDVLSAIAERRIEVEGFKVEYLVLEGDRTSYADRLSHVKDIGFRIEGTPDYYKPKVTYALCQLGGVYAFGLLVKDKFEWHKHKKKPRSYSNSIEQHIAKSLVNLASQGELNHRLLDGCCGVGTVMLEACYAGYAIAGCEINWKTCRNARVNLEAFAYEANVFRADIAHISGRYAAVILDLPYNLLSRSAKGDTIYLIRSAARMTDRLVVVSVEDISETIAEAGFKVAASCRVGKRGKTNFERVVWVCERG